MLQLTPLERVFATSETPGESMFSKYRVSFSADIQKTLTQFPHLGTRRGKPKRGLSFCGGRAGGAARRPLPPLQELLKSCPQQGSPPGSCHSTCPLCQHREGNLSGSVLDSTVVGAQRFTQQSARVGCWAAVLQKHSDADA
jgi:hypothetical protein